MPLLILVLLSAAAAGAADYYVDSRSGADGNDGRSPRQAWRSLARVGSATFLPGDRLFLRAGARFPGRLRLAGSGTAAAPIVVDRYGEGDPPLVTAEGKFPEAVLVENQDHIEIRNLEITNLGPERAERRYGVRARAWDFGVMRNIRLAGLYVHDVNGSLVKRDPGEGHGITWETGGSRIDSRFDGLVIEDSRLVRTDRNGISGYSAYPSGKVKSVLSTGVVVRRNTLEDIGGDGIKVWGCDGALVEHNVVRLARQRCDDYAAGIWPWASDNTVIQFNEVSGLKGAKDGQAFDADGYSDHTYIQYNYSRDNDGGFLLVCGEGSNHTIVRYNISQNDRTRLFHIAGPSRNIHIYNNIFYTGPNLDVLLFMWQGAPDGIRIENNIFYSAGTGRNGVAVRRRPDGTYATQPGFGRATNIEARRNVFYGNYEDVPPEWRVLTADPLLIAPGSGAAGFDSLGGYLLRADSPYRSAGVPVPSPGARDFWGNPLTPAPAPAIGAHQPPPAP